MILLDVGLPGLDGYAVCRQLKGDADLADVPVIFMTTRTSVDDRLTGLALGADEFLSKPVDMRELLLRIQLLFERGRAHRSRAAHDSANTDAEPLKAAPAAETTTGPAPPRHSTTSQHALTYEAFLAVAAEEIARPPAAVALIRLPAGTQHQGARVLLDEVRGRDVIGVYGPAHLLILMPQMDAAVARGRTAPMMARLIAEGFEGSCAGIAGVDAGGSATPQTLINGADEALAQARYLGEPTVLAGERTAPPPPKTTTTGQEAAPPASAASVRTVLIAQEDPAEARLMDAQMVAAGYRTTVANDGEQVLAALKAQPTDVLIIDLMMPKLTGFDVLADLRTSAGVRPKVVVVWPAGNEGDVIRAFELGADDYMTRPFTPQELRARVARLLT